MRKNRRWVIPVVAGFLVVYIVSMGLSTCLSADRYREIFQTAYWTEETRAREMLQTLEETLNGKTDIDAAFEERFARYLLGTICAQGSGYQQFSGAVYDAEGKKVAETESSISMAYGYPYSTLQSQPASWAVQDYLTEEEKEELAGYIALEYQNMREKLSAREHADVPEMFEEYRFTLYVASESREPFGLFVQKMRWEREGEPVKDPLTGEANSSYVDLAHPDERYYLTDGEILWQWGDTRPPQGESFLRSELYPGNMFPCISDGPAAWKSWEENEYLHDFPEELPGTSPEEAPKGQSASGTMDRGKTIIASLSTGSDSGYTMILAYDSHPWPAAMDNMKYVYLGCGILMLVCMWKVLWVVSQTYRKQERLEENRRDFTNAMAHELKTPLGIIRGFSENLLEQVNEEKREYYLRQIIGQTEKMDELAAEMILISRMDAEKLVLQSGEISLGELIQEELEELRVMTEEEKIAVRLEAEEDFLVFGDRFYLTKALRNLLINAVMYNRPGGEIRVLIDARTCVIENTGTQLSKEQLAHAFEMLYRGDESRSGRHTGLGLYLAKRILELQGLSLKIENMEDGVRVAIGKPKDLRAS